MKNITRFKKIVALALLITLIPAQSQAAWYDNLWASVKENAVAIASVAVSAASIFGALWFKTSLASKLKDQEIERLKKAQEEDESDSDVSDSASEHSDDSDDSRGNELAQAKQELASTQAQLALERKLKEKANDRARKAKLRPASARSSILRYHGSNRSAAAKGSQSNSDSENDNAPQPNPQPALRPNVYKLQNNNRRLKRAVINERVRHNRTRVLLRDQVAPALQGLAQQNAELRAVGLHVAIEAQGIADENTQWQASARQLAIENSALRQAVLEKQSQANMEIAQATQDAGTQTAASPNATQQAQQASLEEKYKAEIAALQEKLRVSVDSSAYQTMAAGFAVKIEQLTQANEALRTDNNRLRNLNTQLLAKPASNAPALSATTVPNAGAAKSAAATHAAATATGVAERTAKVKPPTGKQRRAANASRAAETPPATAAPKASATAKPATQNPMQLLSAATAVAKVDADRSKSADQSISLAQIPEFERSASGHIKGYTKLKAEQKNERTLQSYRSNFTTLSANADKLLVLAGIDSTDQKCIAAIKSNCDRLIVEINALLKQQADMQKSTDSLQPSPDADKAALRKRNSEALVAQSEKEQMTAFAKAEEHVRLLDKAINSHLSTYAKLSDEAAELGRAATATKEMLNQARGGIRMLNFLQDRWQPLANLERTFQTNLVADKYEPIDPKKAYEYIDLDSAYAAQINAKVLYEYVMQTVIPTAERLEASELKAKKLNILRQVGGYIFSNDVMKETYDAFIKGEKALEEIKKHGSQARAIELLAQLQALQFKLCELEDAIKLKISKLGKAKNETPTPAAGAADAAAQKTGMMSAAFGALGSAASAVAQRVGLSASPSPAVAEDEPFESITFARDDQDKIVTDASGAPKVANRRAVMAPPAPAPTPLAIPAQPNADAPQQIVRTATPMAQLKDLSPDAAAGIKAAAATAAGAASTAK
jgi:hypothetical protein